MKYFLVLYLFFIGLKLYAQKEFMTSDCHNCVKEINEEVNLKNIFDFPEKYRTTHKIFIDNLYLKHTKKPPTTIALFKTNPQHNIYTHGHGIVCIEYNRGYIYKVFDDINKNLKWSMDNEEMSFKNHVLMAFDFKDGKLYFVFNIREQFKQVADFMLKNKKLDKVIIVTPFRVLKFR